MFLGGEIYTVNTKKEETYSATEISNSSIEENYRLKKIEKRVHFEVCLNVTESRFK